jgi:hypothetical protein
MLWPVSDRATHPTMLWPVSDRATHPTEGLQDRGRPSVGGFDGVGDLAEQASRRSAATWVGLSETDVVF